VFGPQKGADPAAVTRLTERLVRLRRHYAAEFGLDPQELVGSGAAGGLAGGLAVLGARLVPGVDLIAAETGLDAAIAAADLVITGEGRLDATSWQGKVVGAVCERARAAGTPVLVVAGAADGPGPPDGVEIVTLVEAVGTGRAFGDTLRAIEDATAAVLGRWKEGRHD
jgi:glycerate kinase